MKTRIYASPAVKGLNMLNQLLLYCSCIPSEGRTSIIIYVGILKMLLHDGFRGQHAVFQILANCGPVSQTISQH